MQSIIHQRAKRDVHAQPGYITGFLQYIVVLQKPDEIEVIGSHLFKSLCFALRKRRKKWTFRVDTQLASLIKIDTPADMRHIAILFPVVLDTILSHIIIPPIMQPSAA